jgi:putative oxidoreductase
MSGADRYLTLLGRLLIAWLFIASGIAKLGAPAATIAAFGAREGLPLPVVAYAIAVIVEVGFGVLLLIGFQTALTGIVLAVWCVATALAAHTGWANPDMKIHFMKNIAIAGGLLFVAVHGAGAFSVDAMLGRRNRSDRLASPS